MKVRRRSAKTIGRPRLSNAASHEAILTAVYQLLQEMTVRELTMEKVARHAGVGKPTLYRWWNTKASLVVAMFNERVVPTLEATNPTSVDEAIALKVEKLIAAFNGFFGKVISELVAEGQSNPDVLTELNEHYVKPRRAGTIRDIAEAQKLGLVPAHVDPEIVVDAIFGSLYFNLLLKIRPLSPAYGKQLVQTCRKLLEV